MRLRVPSGNVAARKKDEVVNKPKVDKAIDSAKQILSTTSFIGSYHSHPNTSSFEDWAEPSNGDVNYINQHKNTYELIIALSRNGKSNKPLTLEYQTKAGYKYFYDKNSELHDSPKLTQLNNEFQYITGEFKKYRFEVRAYKYIGNGLCDINLYSSEAEMLMRLLAENISIDKLTSQGVYRLKKLEYNFRPMHKKTGTKYQRVAQNIAYHVDQLKKEMANQ